ncbi:carbon catabolite repressor protein 4 homolog 5-like isoform X2 [Neltuma alba]|uniref:carbon catabolite repressor protein 4 homolog 5-like isoform X2 n=1 Tax=Neltuma alba TaxID=207710 RepID=UPI0010A33AA4|nr:carbon catabolite repressor protein 4 homolog 5-like isoform X2 [Prosopis alba]XP_028793063.1 carbon catabolite repressor protein 4 homolog 5-like isoform X2 [Prosopis alba]
MTNPNRERPKPEISNASHLAKRRMSSQMESSSTHMKKRRLFLKSEPVTRNPRPNRSLHTSNQFKAFRSSSRGRRKKMARKSNNEVSSRRWVFSSEDHFNNKDKIVVVSYNILGVENALKHPDLYSNIPHRFLEWDRRKLLIREEEVDRFDNLDNLLQNDGFKGVYKARTGEAYDGCAVFWKDKLFTLLHEEDIEFQQFGLRNNVAQLCIFEVNHDTLESDVCSPTALTPFTRNRRFLVGNIHVLFNPNRGDIKLGQVRLFVDKAYKLSQEWDNIPVILAGDLNSVPQSAIYEFLASSKLDIQLYNRRNMSGQLEASSSCRVFRPEVGYEASISMSVRRQLGYRWSKEELGLATGAAGVTHLRSHLKLQSAYAGVPGNNKTRDDTGEPLATSYHSKFMGTVDYIWHTKEFVPVRVLETLPIDILRRTKGLPSEKWGSDHLALVCEFAFASNEDRSQFA